MEAAALLALAFVAGMDGTAVGQFMISRPLVCGVLAGVIVGDVTLGIAVGGLLEVYHLPAIPVGGGRYPEPGPAAVVGVFAGRLAWVREAGSVEAAAELPPLHPFIFPEAPGALPTGVFFALVFSLLGGWVQEGARTLTVRWLPADDAPGLSRALSKVHRRGALLSGLRGLGVAVLGMLLAAGLVPYLGPWPLGAALTWILLLWTACIPLGSLLAVFGGARRLGWWTAGGLAAGLLLGWVG